MKKFSYSQFKVIDKAMEEKKDLTTLTKEDFETQEKKELEVDKIKKTKIKLLKDYVSRRDYLIWYDIEMQKFAILNKFDSSIVYYPALAFKKIISYELFIESNKGVNLGDLELITVFGIKKQKYLPTCEESENFNHIDYCINTFVKSKYMKEEEEGECEALEFPRIKELLTSIAGNKYDELIQWIKNTFANRVRNKKSIHIHTNDNNVLLFFSFLMKELLGNNANCNVSYDEFCGKSSKFMFRKMLAIIVDLDRPLSCKTVTSEVKNILSKIGLEKINSDKKVILDNENKCNLIFLSMFEDVNCFHSITGHLTSYKKLIEERLIRYVCFLDDDKKNFDYVSRVCFQKSIKKELKSFAIFLKKRGIDNDDIHGTGAATGTTAGATDATTGATTAGATTAGATTAGATTATTATTARTTDETHATTA